MHVALRPSLPILYMPALRDDLKILLPFNFSIIFFHAMYTIALKNLMHKRLTFLLSHSSEFNDVTNCIGYVYLGSIVNISVICPV